MNIPITSPASSAEGGVSVRASGTQETSRGLRLVHLWLIVPLVVAWFAASIAYIEPYDIWWNLKSGEIMMQTGQFLGTDVLVWTPVRLPYSNPQWGSQLLFYWLYDLSPYLLLTVRAIIITGSVGLLMACCFSRSLSLRVATLAAVVAYFTAWTNYGMRPQLLAFIPFLAYLFILEHKDTRPRLLPLLVPIMLFWVNVHGSFFLGLALIAIYALGSILEKLGSDGRKWLTSKAAFWQAGWFAAAGLITLANPYVFGIYNYFFAATNDPIARSLNREWQAPTIYTGTGILFFLNVLVLLGTFYLSKRRLRVTEVLVIMAFGYLALTSLRNVMWWGWVTAPILASNLSAWATRGKSAEEQATEETAQPAVEAAQPNRRTELPALNWAMAVLLVGGALFFTPLWREVNPLVPATAKAAISDATPIKLAEYLKSSNPPAPLFNYMEWGGYLGWEMYPRYQMFIDGRFEAREVQVWDDYLSVSNARADWQKTLDRYKVRTLILNKTFHDELIPIVDETPAWRKVYDDEMGVVYTR